MNDEISDEVVDQVDTIDEYCRRIQVEFDELMLAWPFDMARNEIREVVGALLSRQKTLAQQMALSPNTWNGHVAPLILRSMADVHITLIWIMANAEERAKAFVLYGLGQQKLELEHRKAHMAGRTPQEGEVEYIKKTENWLNHQRVEFLTEVNLGSWSGKNTREMAIDAGCLDFYNYVYTPFSACVHSTWNHVARYNLQECKNPLHGQHRVPKSFEPESDPYYLYLAAKYLQKSLSTFSTRFEIQHSRVSAFSWLHGVIYNDGVDAKQTEEI